MQILSLNRTLCTSRIAGAAFLAASLAVAAQAAQTFLVDFGADASQTTGGVAPTPIYWNNVPASMAGVDGNILPQLVTTNNTATDMNLEIVSRFNGANENGVTSGGPGNYPGTATRDSLFGNTELFSGLENITPIIKLSGLSAGATYSLTFYASRTGVADNRETRYTITGASEATRDLNVANNTTTTVSAANVAPDANGEITIALTPGPNNNNANHFVYLGVLQIDPSTGSRLYIDFGADGSQTVAGTEPPSPFWNNVTATVGITADGVVPSIVVTNGDATAYSIQMVARFNGANTAGSTVSTLYPTTATSDSLFGNTEAFSGLSNIKPVFKLKGLETGNVYSFTFYGSRAGVTDNRETRYTATGLNSGFADLNASNNTNNTATVAGIRPDTNGEIKIELTPGPNNNNANHFTYLGVMRVDFEEFREPQILVDFGAPGRPVTAASDPNNAWNNVTAVEGGTDTGAVTNLVKTGGSATGISLQMISRFNGANENGTEGSSFWNLDATRDSLFGNTESFNGLENVTPIFKLTGLDKNTAYKFTLYASRTGVGDTRETRYTLTGESVAQKDLNVANNVDEFVEFNDVFPNAAGEVRIALTPGPNNDNANHFIYLGVMQIDWSSTPTVRPTLHAVSWSANTFHLTLTGVAGKTYKILSTADFSSWSDTGVSTTLSGTSATVDIAQSEAAMFYRAVQQ